MNSINPLENLRVRVRALLDRFDLNQNENNLFAGVDAIVLPALSDVVSDEFMPLKERHLVGGGDDGKALVVHYTKVDTVIKMFRDYIEKERSYLRLYDTFHLNDPDEGKYLISRLDPTAHEKLKALIEANAPCAYVSSFIIPDDSQQSKGVGARDNLVFWRTYGSEGMGCSIMVEAPAARLYKVKYGIDDVRRAADDIEGIRAGIMEAIKPIMDVASDENKKVLMKALSSTLSAELEDILYLYKSMAYSYENEARIIRTKGSIKAVDDEICFEDNSGIQKIRHYYNDESLSASNLLTTDSVITLGPCVPDKENIAYYLEHLKEKSGLVGPKICQSKVSYRSSA